MKRSGFMLLAVIGTACPAVPALAWGPIVHAAVTTRAIDTLPKPLRDYYKDHRLELPSLALDEEPEATPEGPERRFALDALGSFPFLDLPRDEAGLRQKLGDQALERAGKLPFLVRQSHERLVAAMRSADKAAILGESDILAGLVTDLHNPLALGRNYDGQDSGQAGLWVRFSERLPLAMERRLKLSPDAAHFLDDPKEHVVSIMVASYVWLDNLLYLDWLASRGKGGYTEIYYEAFEQRAGDVLRAQLSAAAGSVGSFWYTAWTEAGRPALR